MLELMVSSGTSEEVITILQFLKWKEVKFYVSFEPDEIIYLNQGKDIPLLLKDSMIVARGFYAMVDYVKCNGAYINDCKNR